MEKSMTKSQKEFKDVSSVKNKVDTKDVIPKTIFSRIKKKKNKTTQKMYSYPQTLHLNPLKLLSNTLAIDQLRLKLSLKFLNKTKFYSKTSQ